MSYFESYLFEKRTGQLTQDQKSAVSSLSSRAEVSSSDAYFTYNYGSFSGDPLDILARSGGICKNADVEMSRPVITNEDAGELPLPQRR